MWNDLTREEELELIKEESKKHPVLIFKHSTRCSISSTALSRLERNWKEGETGKIKAYFLDLLTYRPVSNAIEYLFDVTHQSPQALLISNGKCIYHASHLSINVPEIVQKCKETV